MKLGDFVEGALAKIGVTEEKVSKFLGRPCNCRKRKERMNRLGEWARRVISGSASDAEARDELADVIEDESVREAPKSE